MTEQSTLQEFEFFNNLLEGCQIISYDWKYLFVNHPVLEHARKSWEDLLGKTMMEAYPGIENTDVFASLKQVMETRHVIRRENEFTYPDGRKGWFDLNILPWQDGIMILSLDITHLKEAGSR
jgi:hypothetical protein